MSVFEQHVWNKGLDFALLSLDLIAPLEEVTFKIYETKTKKKSKPSGTSIIIIPADKGSTTVAMGKLEYLEKFTNLFWDGKYKRKRFDPKIPAEAVTIPK